VALKEELQVLLAPLQALQKLIEKFNNRGVVIGGVASSILGKPRLTADIDVMVLLSTENIQKFLDAAISSGFVPRIENSIDFGRKNRVLLLKHMESSINIDISLGILPFEEEVIQRSRRIEVEKILIQLPTPEDLIIMKAIAHRPKDMMDIQGILEINPDLDKSRIKFWVEQFSEALEMPELWIDLEDIFKKFTHTLDNT